MFRKAASRYGHHGAQTWKLARILKSHKGYFTRAVSSWNVVEHMHLAARLTNTLPSFPTLRNCRFFFSLNQRLPHTST